MSNDEFTHRNIKALNKRVLRMGIAPNYGVDEGDLRYAAERGANYWLWSSRNKNLTPVLRELLQEDRDKHVVAVLSGFAYTAGMVRRTVDKALRQLNTDYIDVYKLPWLGRMSRFAPGIEDELEALKAAGKIRASGTSIHDRPRAGQLARDSKLDAFMIRYNAKHPGAERDIFPSLEVREPFVVAYTATSWRQLLRPIKGLEVERWPENSSDAMSAAQCYRFCLSSPHVDLVLTGPANREQLDDNLAALAAGPLSDDEEAWVRKYGAEVKAKRRLDYV